MEDLDQILKDYVATYQNPKYGGDWDIVNNKFPELSEYDPQVLKDYVTTYQNPKYGGDWGVVNSKFPELFPDGYTAPEKKETPARESESLKDLQTLNLDLRSAVDDAIVYSEQAKMTEVQKSESNKDDALKSIASGEYVDELEKYKNPDYAYENKKEKYESPEKIKQKAFNEKLKENIISQAEKKAGRPLTQDELRSLEDDLYKKFDMGLDLSGDGKYNNMNYVGSLAKKFGAAAADVALTIESYASPNPARRAIAPIERKAAQEWSRKNTIQREYDVLEALENGNVLGALGAAGETTAESLPIMAVGAVAGAASGGTAVPLVTVGLITSGQTHLDVKDEEWYKEMNPYQQIGYSLGMGAFEAVGEVTGAKILSRTIADVVKKSAKDQVEKRIGDIVKGYLKSQGQNFKEEAVAEAVTAAGQGVIERVTKGEDFDDLLREIINASITGGLAGTSIGSLKTPRVALDIAMSFTRKSPSVKEKRAEISQLTADYNKAVQDGASEVVLNEFETKIKEATTDLTSSLKKNVAMFENMDEATAEELLGLQQNIESLGQAIKETDNEAVIESLNEKRKQYAERMQTILDDATGRSAYIRDGRRFTKEEFTSMIEEATPEQLAKGEWSVKNDPDVSDMLASKLQENEKTDETPEENVEPVQEEADQQDVQQEEEVTVEDTEEPVLTREQQVEADLLEEELKAQEEATTKEEEVTQEEATTKEEAVQEEVIQEEETTAKISEGSQADEQVKRVKELPEEAEDGSTLNTDGTVYEDGGLVTPLASVNVSQKDFSIDKINEFLDRFKDLLGNQAVKVGIYKFPNSDQVSIDLNLIVPEANQDVAVEFAKNSGQKSLFNLSDFSYIETGADGQNTTEYTVDEMAEIVEALTNGELPNINRDISTPESKEKSTPKKRKSTLKEPVLVFRDQKALNKFKAIPSLSRAIANAALGKLKVGENKIELKRGYKITDLLKAIAADKTGGITVENAGSLETEAKVDEVTGTPDLKATDYIVEDVDMDIDETIDINEISTPEPKKKEAPKKKKETPKKKETKKKAPKKKETPKKKEPTDQDKKFIDGYIAMLLATGFPKGNIKENTALGEIAIKTMNGIAFLKLTADGWVSGMPVRTKTGSIAIRPIPEGEGAINFGKNKEIAIENASVRAKRFRLRSDAETGVSQSDQDVIGADVEAIETEMADAGSGIMNLDNIVPEESATMDAGSRVTEQEARASGLPSLSALMKPFEWFKGLRGIVGISDPLATGTTKDSQGNNMEVHGGLLWNIKNAAQRGMAWASVKEDTARKSAQQAINVYKAHKAELESLWKSGKIPFGHVPLFIFRMTDTSIRSNEAVFRWILPSIKKVGKLRDKAALVEIKKRVKENSKKGGPIGRANKALYDLMQKTKSQSLSELMEAIIKNPTDIPLNARTVLTNLVFSDSGQGRIAKILTGGRSPLSSEIFSFPKLHESIFDADMANLPAGYFAVMQGVQILKEDGSEMSVDDIVVTDSPHPNYQFGLKGRPIAIPKETYQVSKMFPEIAAKTKEQMAVSEGKSPNRAMTQSHTTFYTPDAFAGAEVNTRPTELDMVIGAMRLAFPSVQVTSNRVEFQRVINDSSTRVRESNGMKIYGVTANGIIYLNPDIANITTAIHEFGHIWIDYLKTSEKGARILEKGLALAKMTDQYKVELEKYPDDPRLAAEEALVELIATKGSAIINAAKRRNFNNWLSDAFQYIKNTFTKLSDFMKESDAKFQDRLDKMTVEDFVNMSLADLFSMSTITGGPISGEGLRMSMKKDFEDGTGRDFDFSSMDSIINYARDKGYSDFAIMEVLRLRGFKVKDIKAKLEVNVRKAKGPVPAEFSLVEGGMKAGVELFKDLRKKMVSWHATRKNRTGKAPSSAQIRKHYIDTLNKSPLFENLSENDKIRLLLAVDRYFGIKAGKEISKDIARKKEKLRNSKSSEIKKTQIELNKFIREVLIPVGYTKNQISRLITAVSRATDSGKLEAMKVKVMELADKKIEETRQKLIKDIQTAAKSKGKIIKSASGKRSANRVDADTQKYFEFAKQVISKSMSGDISALQDLLYELENNVDVLSAVAALSNSGPNAPGITSEARNKALQYLAISDFINIADMSYDQVNELYSRVMTIQKIGAARFADFVAEKSQAIQELKDRAREEIKEGWGDSIYDENGEVLSKNEYEARKKNFWKSKDGKSFFGKIVPYLQNQFSYNVPSFVKFVRNTIGHLGTFANELDRKGSIFKEYIYDKLNQMDSDFKKGYFDAKDTLDSMAEQIGFKNYRDFTRKLASKPNLFIEGLKGDRSREFTTGELLRIYALSKNEVQFSKLQDIGFTVEKIDEIKAHLGLDIIQMADSIVDWLSTSYYDSINKVYRSVRGIDLGYVHNYFPTETLSQASQADIDGSNFNRIFDAMTAPALKDRIDTTSEISIVPDLNFVDILDKHIDRMERFKAYAEGTRDINYFMQIEDVNRLLEITGMKRIVRALINHSINPEANSSIVDTTWMTKMYSLFTGFVLAFKLIQIPKQATSFINAWSEYKYSDTKVPGVNTTMFMVDMADVILHLPRYVKMAYKMSPEFRDRFEKGMRGEVYSLETGRGVFKKVSKKDGIVAKGVRAMRAASGAPTVLGDIIGVMGYMANYKRNIKNGMPHEEALKAFENYNATQQSRRAGEKNSLQVSDNGYAKALTLFGSTTYLYMNEVMQAMTNMSRGDFSKKNIKKLAASLGMANVLFVMMSNVAKLAFGDDDDMEEVMVGMRDAMLGLNLVYQFPILGAAVEEVVRSSRGQRTYGDGGMINPLTVFFNRTKKDFKNEDYESVAKKVISITLGTNVDPIIALANLFAGDTSDENVYEALGISKSYRPSSSGKESSDSLFDEIDIDSEIELEDDLNLDIDIFDE
jgi:hypothetical protein